MNCTVCNQCTAILFFLLPENPAAAAVNSSLPHYSGENVVINMYASALAPIDNSQIQWELNGVAITDGNFTNNKTSLVINNISPSDDGVYQMIVTIGNQMTANSSTTLIILGRYIGMKIKVKNSHNCVIAGKLCDSKHF